MIKPRLQAAIDEAVANFTDSLIGIIRQATVEELAGVSPAGVSPRRARPELRPVPEPPSAPEPAVEPAEDADEGQAPDEPPRAVKRAPAARQQAVAKTKQKRAWPTCSTPGCSAKMYGPSGPAKLCYKHHVEQGGELSPFARRKKKEASTAESPGTNAQTRPKARKVIRRRKGEEPTRGATTMSNKTPQAVEDPPLSGKDEGLRRVEARLAAKKP